ncbi:unnamed protein product [Diabrotica balteata]|uniref:Receptor ligand binding region domain-containing protein n=1 Tax=Diabrotica balteata TaxID=107213 RepID=A0A9N9X6V1_DIABA|nr:unnamed protein product [Diabrotica balteata]
MYRTIAKCEQGIICLILPNSKRPRAFTGQRSERLIRRTKNRLEYQRGETGLSITTSKSKKVLLKQLETTDSGNYRVALTEVKALGETNYVLVCSTNILEEVLKQLQQVGMMTETYNYLITNLDTQTVDLSPFQYAGTNITAIRMLDPDSKEVTQITENIQKMSALPFSGIPILLQAWKTKLETALIIDAVQLFYETIYDLTKNKKKVIRGVSLSCSNQSNWNEGYTITNLMKSVGIICFLL